MGSPVAASLMKREVKCSIRRRVSPATHQQVVRKTIYPVFEIPMKEHLNWSSGMWEGENTRPGRWSLSFVSICFHANDESHACMYISSYYLFENLMIPTNPDYATRPVSALFSYLLQFISKFLPFVHLSCWTLSSRHHARLLSYTCNWFLSDRFIF